MRTVNIDLSQDTAESREKIYVGYTGEHNATELVAEIPQAMARESDYLIAVFLTGDKIIRSRKITAERDYGAPYLDGDEVHIFLSQKLTGNTTLGIQIEGYAKDENGISVLVGKSAYISNLTFRLSPKGSSDDGVLPDYDEILELIRQVSENAKGGGIEKYDNCTLLPTDAEEGDTAAQAYSARNWSAETVVAGTGIRHGTPPTNTAQRYGGAITSTQTKKADAAPRQSPRMKSRADS